MSGNKYAIGIDFGTESGRALLVDVADGRHVATAVHLYGDGVIDEVLPGTDIELLPDFALQNPADYIEVLRVTIPAVLQESGVSPGLGVKFPPSDFFPRFGRRPIKPLLFTKPQGDIQKQPIGSCRSSPEKRDAIRVLPAKKLFGINRMVTPAMT